MKTYLPKKLSHGKDLQGVHLSVEGDRKTFTKMLSDCYKYTKAINAKAQPFPSEPVIMALLFSQHKMIEWLKRQISKGKTNVLESFGSIIEGNFTQLSAQRSTEYSMRIPIPLVGASQYSQSRFSLIDSIVLSNASIFSL